MRLPLAILGLIGLSAIAAPAQATGGFLCKTASGPQVEIALGFGHVPGAPLVGHRLRVDGKLIASNAPQWWLDGEEMRLELTSPDAMKSLLVMRTKRVGYHFDGQVEYDGRPRWIRCKES